MKNYWTGIILIIFGAMFLFDSFGLMHFGEVITKYWPVILILVGINILLRERKPKL